MIRTLVKKIKKLVKGKKKDNWGTTQIKELAKLKGKLVLM
jgi:hypothetical protein